MKKKQIIFVAKIIISVALLIYMYYRIGPVWRQSTRTIWMGISTHFLYFFLGMISFAFVAVACTVRWKLLLDAQKVGFTFQVAMKLYFLGLFFSQFMPGGIAGGDVVRAYYVTKQTPDKKEEAVAITILDRFIGILGLTAILIVALFFLTDPRFLKWALYVIGISVLAAIGASLFFSKRIMKGFPYIEKICEKLPYRDTITRIYNSCNHFKHHKLRLVVALLLSTGVHLSLVTIAYFMGKSLGMEVGFRQHLIIMPLVSGLRSIPISPLGDMGTTEAAFIEMYHQTLAPGASSGDLLVAFAFMMRGVYLAWALVGWVIYMRERSKNSEVTLRKIAKGKKRISSEK